MNKDEIQQEKALIKMDIIKQMMDILQKINLLEDDQDMKQYNIELDYEKGQDCPQTIFKITVSYKSKNFYEQVVTNNLFDINFKLYDESLGFNILQSLRQQFVDNNDLQYSGFDIDTYKNKVIAHKIVTNHHVDLHSKIHEDMDLNKLEKFNQKINENYECFTRYAHLSTLDKDQKQTMKAELKAELISKIIAMLSALNSISVRKHSYEIVTSISKAIEQDCYIFDTRVMKDRNSLPFNLGFKLYDKDFGLILISSILKEFKENNNCLECYSTYDNESLYTLRNDNFINLSVKAKDALLSDLKGMDETTYTYKLKKQLI